MFADLNDSDYNEALLIVLKRIASSPTPQETADGIDRDARLALLFLDAATE
jgi:hypothetical protein